MESSLLSRDRVGVQDAVLLENFKSEQEFMDNLKKRYHENIIYVSLFLQNLISKVRNYF